MTDHLGRETGQEAGAQTVTGFAVEQGTLDGDDEGVRQALQEEQERAEAGGRHAQQVSDRMAGDVQQQETQEE